MQDSGRNAHLVSQVPSACCAFVNASEEAERELQTGATGRRGA